MQISLEKLNPYENSFFLSREYIQPGFKSPRHYHEEFELTYIEESYGKLYMGNSIVDFKKGDLFLFAPRLIHCFKNSKSYEKTHRDAKAICVFFMRDFLGGEFLRRSPSKLLNALFQKSEFGLLFSNTPPEIIKIFKSLSSSKYLKGITNLLIILDTLSMHKDVTLLSDTMLNKYYYKHSKDVRIDTVINYILSSYQNKITAKEISGLIHMSEAGLSRFFKLRTEKNITEFINEIRISNAQKLLIETNISIHEISIKCGYKNLSYFNRLFKEFNNMSPKDFRGYFLNTNSDRGYLAP